MISVSKCITSVSLVSLMAVGCVVSTPSSATPAFKSYSGAENSYWKGGITSLTIPAPASIVAGDLLIAVFRIQSVGSVSSAPTGWSQLLTSSSNGPGPDAVYVKTATGSEPSSYLWGVSASKGASAVIVDYSNSGSTVSIDSYSSSITKWTPTTTTYTGTIPGISTNASVTKLVTIVVGTAQLNTGWSAYDTFTLPTSESVEATHTEIINTQISGGQAHLYEIGDETLTTSGSTGSRSVTETATSTPTSQPACGGGLLIALD